MPDRVKVGKTDRTGEIRADELYTTGVPLPFEVEFRAITSKPDEVEKAAHRILDSHRPNPRREFFTVPVTDLALGHLETVIRRMDGPRLRRTHRAPNSGFPN
jgi:hypothetical protein